MKKILILVFAIIFLGSLGTLLAKKGIKKPKIVKKKCTVCHTFEKGGKKKIGPNLFNTVGNKTTIVEDGWKWTEKKLHKYLQDPQPALEELSGNPDIKSKMGAIKIKDKKKRKKIIKYLKKLK